MLFRVANKIGTTEPKTIELQAAPSKGDVIVLNGSGKSLLVDTVVWFADFSDPVIVVHHLSVRWHEATMRIAI